MEEKKEEKEVDLKKNKKKTLTSHLPSVSALMDQLAESQTDLHLSLIAPLLSGVRKLKQLIPKDVIKLRKWDMISHFKRANP